MTPTPIPFSARPPAQAAAQPATAGGAGGRLLAGGAAGACERISNTFTREQICTIAPAPGLFVDWLSIHQEHWGAKLPMLSDGCVVRFDADGKPEFTSLLKARFKGSHETSLMLRCDGHCVSLEGNIGRYCRKDNVFGLSFSDVIIKANSFLTVLGLPPFTAGSQFYRASRNGNPVSEWTGAFITRLDLTRNYSAENKENASAFMRWLSAQQASRIKTGTFADGETVDFGRGSKYVYSKAYLKAGELRRHAKKKGLEDDEYLMKVADWCDSVGLVRFEVTYKSFLLRRLGCRFLGGFDMSALVSDFEQRSEVLSRCSCANDDFSHLSKTVLGTFRMWQMGDDLSGLSRWTFRRHRKALLPFGVDIAVKSNVRPFTPRTRVIRLCPVEVPSWYEPASRFVKVQSNGTFG